MEIYFRLITDAAALSEACRELSAEPILGFDTETTELDPYKGELRLVQLGGRKSTVVIDLRAFTNPSDLAPLKNLLSAETPRKIAHNAKFDSKWVGHHLGVEVGGVFDTYLASQLIAAGDSDRRHGLADVSQFFLGTEMDKAEQLSDWSAAELSASQIEYAARDAAIMPGLYEKLVERLANDRLMDVAELENRCVVPIAMMELNGVYLDEARWREKLERVRKAQGKVADELQDMLSAGGGSGVAVWTRRDQSRLSGAGQRGAGRARRTDAEQHSCVGLTAAGRAIPCRGKAARISGRGQIAVQLWREHSRIYRAKDRPYSRRLSPDRCTDGTVLLLESEPAADTARGRISPLLSRSGRQETRHRRLLADRASDSRGVFGRSAVYRGICLGSGFPYCDGGPGF
jgi:Ribonuclease D